jgi:hypothetical protein
MVDAATGAPVAARWNVDSAADAAIEAGIAWVSRRREVGAAADLDDTVRRAVQRWEDGFLPSGAARPDALVPGSWGRSTPVGSIQIRPPPGYVAPGPLDGMPYGTHELAGLLAAGVRVAVAVVPLHREAPLHLRVLAPDGRPAVGAVVRSVVVAGQRRGAVEDVGPGEFRVRGIPHLPGEPVGIAIDWSGEGAAGEAEEISEVVEDVDRPDTTTVVPADLSRPWSVVVRLSGPTGLRLDHNETDNDLPFEESLGASVDVPLGAARVTVLGWDGSPVEGAGVFGRATGANGVVVLPSLPAGEVTFSTRPQGRFRASTTALVRERAQMDVILREPVGAVLDVLVTDETGDPRPSALLTVYGSQVFDVVDGGQRLDRFTDARGRRTFARVEPGEATVQASWGTRHGRATVTLRDGEHTSLRLVAK